MYYTIYSATYKTIAPLVLDKEPEAEEWIGPFESEEQAIAYILDNTNAWVYSAYIGGWEDPTEAIEVGETKSVYIIKAKESWKAE